MYKFFVPENQIEGNQVYITGTDVKHISKVLRLKINDKILVSEKNSAKTYIVNITDFSENTVTGNIIDEKEELVESNVNIDLYQGLPKADKMEYIIQKTTELGVKKVIPVEMERSVVKLDQKAAQKKIDRWNKIAEVAAKQSKRDIIPEVSHIIKIKDICKNIQEYDIILLAYENENKKTIKDELQKFKKEINKQTYINIGIIIGPEGGFSEDEVQYLIDNTNSVCVSLGKRILRTETAALVIISDIIYEFEL